MSLLSGVQLNMDAKFGAYNMPLNYFDNQLGSGLYSAENNLFKFDTNVDYTQFFNSNPMNFNLNIDYADMFKKNSENMINNLASNSLKELGYNSTKGQKLALIAKKNKVGFKGKCATYVKKDIAEAGLGIYQSGHAWQCASILEKNPNFKEISTKGLNLKNLPAGCILVYGRGVSNYNPKYGHIEITIGNGTAISDGTTDNIKPGARVFIPV